MILIDNILNKLISEVMTLVVKMPTSINKSSDLITISCKIFSAKNDEAVVLDFSPLKWIDANLLAAFGAILEANMHRVRLQFITNSMQPQIERLLSKNNFGKYFNLSKISDTNDTIIEYKITNGDDIKEFAKYFKDNVLLRKAMPTLSEGLKDKILENILEIFGNAPMHGGCKKVFSCGQIFPQKNLIKFTIANTGHTIKENVIEYYAHELNTDIYPRKTISWATAENNSTKKIVNGKSGGLGLYYLKQFIEKNGGSINICSSDEFWKYIRNVETTEYLSDIFCGTIVTIEIRTDDNNIYFLEQEANQIFSEF